MTTMAELRAIMTDLSLSSDPDARIRKIYQAGVTDGAYRAVEEEIVNTGDGEFDWDECADLVTLVMSELK